MARPVCGLKFDYICRKRGQKEEQKLTKKKSEKCFVPTAVVNSAKEQLTNSVFEPKVLITVGI